MDRLTTDNPQNNLMTALNLFYAKDGQAWVRGGGPEPDYKDCSLYDYIWETMKGVLDLEDVELIARRPTDEKLGDIMADWLMDGHCCIPGLVAHLYTAAWAFAEIRERLMRYEDLDLTPDEIEHQLMNFSSFLMEMTGGRMSKTNYTVQAMVAEANDVRMEELESAQNEGYDLGVDSVLRHHFDIPWDEAADLRKNIDHLRELLKAEREGRLVMLPCKIDSPIYLIHEEERQKRKPQSFRVDDFDIDHFTIGEAMIPMITACSKDNEWKELIDGSKLGHEYFLSREAAEAALAKDNNVPTKKEEVN